MAVAIRRSVWSLPPGDQTLDWYRKAVAELITRPPSDPSSWRYLAAVHGVPIDSFHHRQTAFGINANTRAGSFCPGIGVMSQASKQWSQRQLLSLVDPMAGPCRTGTTAKI